MQVRDMARLISATTCVYVSDSREAREHSDRPQDSNHDPACEGNKLEGFSPFYSKDMDYS